MDRGGRNTNKILSLEKRNYVNKTVAKLADNDNSRISKQDDILLENRICFFSEKINSVINL